jgi:sulfatase maturation enzyme AslB (radical SAM superfamily)
LRGFSNVQEEINLKMRAGPDGLHIFDRTSGLNVLIDEATLPVSRWSKSPRQVSIALTNACDLRCQHCYAPKEAGRLGFAQVAGWLKELAENGCLGVGFGGGEPTLHPDFVSLCRFAATETDLAVTFTTHAHRFDKDLAASLRGYVHFIRVSMDGVRDTYELVRGRRFDAFLDRLQDIRMTAPFGINFVVNATTISDLDEAVGLAMETGAIEFLLLPERPTDSTPGIDTHARHKLKDWVASYSGDIRLAISEADCDGFPVCDPLPHEMGLRSYAHVDARATLKRSSFEKFGINIGSSEIMGALVELEAATGRTQ